MKIFTHLKRSYISAIVLLKILLLVSSILREAHYQPAGPDTVPEMRCSLTSPKM